MADVQPFDMSSGDATEDEHKIVAEIVEHETPERFNDYGYADLLVALRKGYELGQRDALDGAPWRESW